MTVWKSKIFMAIQMLRHVRQSVYQGTASDVPLMATALAAGAFRG